MSIMWYQIAIGSGLAAQANFFLWHVQLYLDNYFLANLLWLGLLGLEIGFLVFSECGDVKAGTPSPIPDVDDYIYFANWNHSIWSTAEVRVPFVRRHRFISWNVGPRKLFHKLVPLVSVLAKLKRWGAQGLPQGAPSREQSPKNSVFSPRPCQNPIAFSSIENYKYEPAFAK